MFTGHRLILLDVSNYKAVKTNRPLKVMANKVGKGFTIMVSLKELLSVYFKVKSSCDWE